MEFTNLIKTTGSETVNGVTINFVFEHEEGETPAEISMSFTTVKDNQAVNYSGKYIVSTQRITHQLFNAPLQEYIAVLTAIETSINTIVESFNTQE